MANTLLFWLKYLCLSLCLKVSNKPWLCHRAMANKRVLVQIGSNRRPVTFNCKPEACEEMLEFKKAVLESFRDVLSTTDAYQDLLVQVKSEEWGGEFIDVLDYIPDKSIVKVRVNSAEVSHHSISMSRSSYLCLFQLPLISHRGLQVISPRKPLLQLSVVLLLGPVD